MSYKRILLAKVFVSALAVLLSMKGLSDVSFGKIYEALNDDEGLTLGRWDDFYMGAIVAIPVVGDDFAPEDIILKPGNYIDYGEPYVWSEQEMWDEYGSKFYNACQAGALDLESDVVGNTKVWYWQNWDGDDDMELITEVWGKNFEQSPANGVLKDRKWLMIPTGIWPQAGVHEFSVIVSNANTVATKLVSFKMTSDQKAVAATVLFDANGGRVDEYGRVVRLNATVGELPVPDERKGYEFAGWYTDKTKGTKISASTKVTKAMTVYARWSASDYSHTISVVGGFLFDDYGEEKTTLSGLECGDEVAVLIDEGKLYDKYQNWVNAFAYWSYTPATADLGDGFNPLAPEVTVSMPNADVKLTANYVNGFAAYLYPSYSMEGEAEEGDFYWSMDNGKTLFKFDAEFPVKAGKVTLKFYDKTGRWRAADVTLTVDKRGTYKEGAITRYDDPDFCFVNAKFVPVDDSTKVKFDLNGGTGAGEAFFAHGWEYGAIDMPSRKGYVFAGWWTAKDGGEHITPYRIFDPADFAGQKTPTLYAHWLQMKKLTLKDVPEDAYAAWSIDENLFEDLYLYEEIMFSLTLSNPEFEGGGYLAGKGVLEVLPGARVVVSVPGGRKDNKGNDLMFQKWAVSPSTANFGPNFRVTSCETELTMPDAAVTLQPTYIDESICGGLCAWAHAYSIYIGGDEEYIEPPYEAFEWSPDGGKTWYKAASVMDEFGETAMLKAGSYTVTWRSTDPCWQAPSSKTKATVVTYNYGDAAWVDATFTYIPQVVVDVMTFENGQCTESPAGGTVTMNPKDGLVPSDKSITLTAKAAKGYVFQGWAIRKYWQYGSWWEETSTTYKITNSLCSELCNYIDPDDQKVHVVAVFKALSAYRAEDIKFWSESEEAYVDMSSDELYARAGCEAKYAVDCPETAGPYTYKMGGKLPSGMKFDSKTGVVSGAPSKEGDATVTITVSDPAKNSKTLALNIHVGKMAKWLAGEYRAALSRGGGNSCVWDEEQQMYVCEDLPSTMSGILELSVTSAGKVSAKVITRYGTRSVSGALSWEPDDEDVGNGEGYYWFEAKETKDEEECWVDFYPDGTISGYADSYLKSEEHYVGGNVVGMRQDTALLEGAPFLDKYYTFAFSSATTTSGEGYVWDDEQSDWVWSEWEDTIRSGYGYLTLKTDKKGVAKVAGQLPDGEKVSMSALMLPFVDEDDGGVVKARMCLFASPSSYKKEDWFAMSLVVAPDGVAYSEDGAAWTVAGGGGSAGACGPDESQKATVSGFGTVYSAAATLENYYWYVSCEWSEDVLLEYSWKETYLDDYGKARSYAEYGEAYAQEFGGYLFNVAVKGDKKGAISLAEKSPAPWKDGDWWNYYVDKKGNEITDPSQLSISFTKATGIFTGKASVYFDYDVPIYKQNSKTKEIETTWTMQHATASLPYAGVMIDDGNGGYTGLGSAVYTYKYQHMDDSGKTKTDTKKISLPVSLE